MKYLCCVLEQLRHFICCLLVLVKPRYWEMKSGNMAVSCWHLSVRSSICRGKLVHSITWFTLFEIFWWYLEYILFWVIMVCYVQEYLLSFASCLRYVPCGNCAYPWLIHFKTWWSVYCVNPPPPPPPFHFWIISLEWILNGNSCELSILAFKIFW